MKYYICRYAGIDLKTRVREMHKWLDLYPRNPGIHRMVYETNQEGGHIYLEFWSEEIGKEFHRNFYDLVTTERPPEDEYDRTFKNGSCVVSNYEIVKRHQTGINE